MRHARAYIPNAVFFIPFGYYYAVRLGTLPKLLSWALIYLMPTAFYAATGYSGSWGIYVVNYLLILIATFSLYEYGYIYNDTIAIAHEQQPAIRLYAYNMEFFHRFHPWIIVARTSYTVLALLALHILNEDSPNVIRVDISIAAMGLLFALYNEYRSKQNVWLYPLLVCSRYIPFMLLYTHGWVDYGMLFLSFPLLNAIERFSMPRYRWPIIRRLIPDEASKTRFRVYYYLIALLIITPLIYFTHQQPALLIPILLLGIYRLSLMFWLKRHNPTNYLNG